MSFITKRDRVFHDYELFDLPSRNEGKLKAYASCTDARAWSHFCSDKTEHLVDIIKRNNETCRPKYVPTDVIVNTLMRSKNKEIARLRRRIEEVEEMLAVYDQLDLSSDQKQEIQHAHASIKKANKDLEDMFLDLNASGYTEGIDSEAFETGKSRDYDADVHSMHRPRGDETGDSILNEASLCSWPEHCPAKQDCKCIQIGESVRCDVETSAEDPRIEELQDTIVQKDARLSALQNIKAVLENDICEPYCVYAHIHTALEKIFAVLGHNEKYKKYLDAMLTGRDTRNFDIKGRIVFKMKVLETFNLALIAPCSQDSIMYGEDNCHCCNKVSNRTETTIANIALIPSNAHIFSLDSKRAHLVADIMENVEMQEILNKETDEPKPTTSQLEEEPAEDIFSAETHNVNLINVKRIKDLQQSYDELMICFDNLKHEKSDLEGQLLRHQRLEEELNELRNEFKDHSQVIQEREFYKRKSQQLSDLEEKCFSLSEEASNLKVQLKAESEINIIKHNTIDELKSSHYELEKSLDEASSAFDKERNALQCKIKEMECKIMCQEQQIKSLSSQIDQLLEQKDSNIEDPVLHADQIDSLKEQIANLKEVILCKEEEKQNLYCKYQDSIAKLRADIEAWRNDYDKLLSRNEFLEETTSGLDRKLQELITTTKEKDAAKENLLSIITNKTEKLNELEEALQRKNLENRELLNKLKNVKGSFSSHLLSLEAEKREAEASLQLAKQESKELMDKVKSYSELIQRQEDMSKSYETNSAIMSGEIQILRDLNNDILKDKQNLQDELDNYKQQLEVSQDECRMLKNKLSKLDDLTNQFKALQASYDKLLSDKKALERELCNKTDELDRTRQFIEIERKKSGDLVCKLMESETSIDDAKKLHKAYLKMSKEKQATQNKNDELSKLIQNVNDELSRKNDEVNGLMKELDNLKAMYDNLLLEKNELEKHSEEKKEELQKLREKLNKKNEENENLTQQVQELESHKQRARTKSLSLEAENNDLHGALQNLKRESKILDDKMKQYKQLQEQYNNLKRTHDSMQAENIDLNKSLQALKSQNDDLNKEKNHIQRYSEDIEKSLLQMRESALTSNLPDNLIHDIQKEVEKLKHEKLDAQKTIHGLQDKLEESVNIIENQTQTLQAREDRIAALEKQISQLQDHIKTLFDQLNSVINLGEQIKDNSLEHVNQSLQSMQARQSKATHNMKLELAKLQSEKAKLETQLSTHQLVTMQQYADNLKKLEQEREVIVKEIQQLELLCIGESTLSLDYWDVDAVLNSLFQIGQCIESNTHKRATLEDNLAKVQNSAQMIVNKAGEAQQIAEKEQQKINEEKEAAIKEKQQLEQQLSNLKGKLEKQVNDDKKMIKDLEATALNQTLIIKKITDDINSLQNLYENCLATINSLQESNINLTEENKQNIAALEAAKKDLLIKSEQLRALQTELHLLKNKPLVDCSSQVQREDFNKNVDCQTDEQIDVTKNEYESSDLGSVKFHKRINRKGLKYTPNEVQVLRADVDSTQDFVQNVNPFHKKDDNSQSKSNKPVESYKEVDSRPESNTSNFIDLEIDKNAKQLAYAADLFKTQSNTNSSFDEDIDQSTNTNLSPQVLTIYDKSPEERFKSKKIQKSMSDKNKKNQPGKATSVKLDSTKTSFTEDNKSLNSDVSSTYISLAQTTQSATNIKKKEPYAALESPSLTNISNKSSNHYYNQDKLVFTVKTNEPRYAAVKQKQTDLLPNSEHTLNRVDGNDKLFPRKTRTNEKVSKNNASFPSVSKKTRSHSEEGKRQMTDKAETTPTWCSLTKSQQTDESCLTPNYQASESAADRQLIDKLNATIDQNKLEIDYLNKALEKMEKDYKQKLDGFKAQYDVHIKSILNEHNQGVTSMQSLHEETLQDIINTHENEVENLRALSFEAMRKAEKLEKENSSLRIKHKIHAMDENIHDSQRFTSLDCKCLKQQRMKKTKTLTKTSVEEFNVHPKPRAYGPCTCSMDINVSDTIRNIMEQADADQRKVEENKHMKFITNKVILYGIDTLNSQELSFLHLKVCRAWKSKINKEEVMQAALIKKQRNAQKNIEELDRQVAEEKRRLDEVREAVYSSGPLEHTELGAHVAHAPLTDINACTCNPDACAPLGERRSYGDLVMKHSLRPKRARQETNRSIQTKRVQEERREKRGCNDEQPVRLRRSPPPKYRKPSN